MGARAVSEIPMRSPTTGWKPDTYINSLSLDRPATLKRTGCWLRTMALSTMKPGRCLQTQAASHMVPVRESGSFTPTPQRFSVFIPKAE
ncbi:hypothetical protein SKAU_G00226290 [Synaphobranchus kaupii]|uniref:Uncharacterized protein n=1 Tax=Synaphobranchus kaupii TaxID=118154 RepID=A0A9Q1F4S4_SYNKA|nr:hypothetical protein SKAU_G00226290 [Synaphobranchus kaupii]